MRRRGALMTSSIGRLVELSVPDSLPLALRLYRLGCVLGSPLAFRLLTRRLKRGKEHPERMTERLGQASIARPAGPLVWVHGASVGEMLAVISLIERLRAQHFAVLVTSGTVTSAALAEQRLPDGVLHQFVPLDAPRFVHRFLDHWRPGLALFVESDLWPNLICSCAARRIPMIVINGRLSERSFSRWRRVPGVIAALLNRFELCLTQSAADAERYAKLGAPRVSATGNLKLDLPAPPADDAVLGRLKQIVGRRPVVVAASTHPGEEAPVVGAHRRLRAKFPTLLTIIVPRHRKERGRRDRAALAPRATDAGHRDLYCRYIGRARPDVPAGADRVHGRIAGAPRRAKSNRGNPARGCGHPRAACVELC
jgi:3-deoxy-D-manno-octulosonic-acid transferase